MRSDRRDHISQVLASLHWLSVKFRIEFKILLTHKALNDQAPSYLKDLIVRYFPNTALRSQTAGLLVVPRVSKSRMGGRALKGNSGILNLDLISVMKYVYLVTRTVWRKSASFGRYLDNSRPI